VFLASGEHFADALGGASAAAGLGVPLLLTTDDSLPAATSAALAMLDPDAVHVLGGTASVSDGIVAELRALGFDVDRLAGDDRYATSAAIARSAFATAGEVVVATGADFPDGLVAGALGEPLLLVPPAGVPTSTRAALDALAPARLLLLGGTGSIATATESGLTGALGA
jgi:putative cell wall-binding protein